jgi:hypothetical protein
MIVEVGRKYEGGGGSRRKRKGSGEKSRVAGFNEQFTAEFRPGYELYYCFPRELEALLLLSLPIFLNP